MKKVLTNELHCKQKFNSIMLFAWFCSVFIFNSCNSKTKNQTENQMLTAKDILGNNKYQAISFGGYRELSRDIQPTIDELKEDVQILSAMGIKLLRTYNVSYDEAANLLQAISELKTVNPDFEMYLMLGVWIDCKDARTENPIHDQESEKNEIEIERAIELTNKYPEIVKIIAVGNEAMVHWASSYYVTPNIILKWVKYLQDFKNKGLLPESVWITSSDNFASWGGGGSEYHIKDLNELIVAVDFISMHTYPMHDTHYNPEFWGVPDTDTSFSDAKKIETAMLRAKNYAQFQYQNVVRYMQSLGVQKPVIIGETGWASHSNEFYGNEGSHAVDEYKAAIYFKLMREWTNQEKITCFYFEAFDEQWKDANNPDGSENHFGLINLQSEAKMAIWDLVDNGTFNGLKRGGKPITKTHNGDSNTVLQSVLAPPTAQQIKSKQ